jgi:hypothetical protein
MNSEFKLYVEAVCKEAIAPELADTKRRTPLQKFFDWIESFGPYVCELRPLRRMHAAVRDCCTRKEVIGFHGLA